MTIRIKLYRFCSLCLLSSGLLATAQLSPGVTASNATPNSPAIQQLIAQGRAFNEGTASPRNFKKAFAFFQQAHQQGSMEATAWLGSMYLRGHGVKQDTGQARTLIESAAAGENPIGLRFMGVLYQNGIGTSQDYSKAQEYYRKAMSLGDGNASGRLGVMYLEGFGVPPDKTMALRLLVQGANKNDVWSESQLAMIYEGGPKAKDQTQTISILALPTKTPNYTLALLYYQKAAEAGSKFAIFHVGQMYERGRGVTQDYAQAATFYKKAASRGFAPAQLALARLYEQGLGTEVNYVHAYVFYSLAARRDNLAAAEGLQQVSHKMTDPQRQQAEMLLDKIHERFASPQSGANEQ